MKKILLLTVLLVAAASAAMTITFPDGKPTTVGVPVRVVITSGSASEADLFVNPGTRTWAYKTSVPLGDTFKFDGNIEITHPGTGLTLYASKGAEFGESESFDVVEGDPAKWLIIAPGETHEPGEADEPDGKTGTASVTAGDSADYTIFICDKWNNEVTGSQTPTLSSTDDFARLPVTADTGVNKIELRTADIQTVTVTGSGLTQNDVNVDVKPGTVTQLLIICNGETHVAGDTLTADNKGGKTGAPARAVVGVQYDVDVLAVDDAWNVNESYTGSAFVTGGSSGGLTSDTVAFDDGIAEVHVFFTGPAENGKNIYASTVAGGLDAYATQVFVDPGIYGITISLNPSIVPKGVHSTLTAKVVSDSAGTPVANFPVKLELIESELKSSFHMIQTVPPYRESNDTLTITTLSNGEATAEVWADAETTYTIKATAGTKEKTAILKVQEITGLTIIPNPWKNGAVGYGDAINFSYKVDQAGAAEVMLMITDIYGNVVYKNTYTSGAPVQPGQQTISWDIKNGKGNSISSGMYQAVLKITLTNLSTEVLRKNLMVIW